MSELNLLHHHADLRQKLPAQITIQSQFKTLAGCGRFYLRFKVIGVDRQNQISHAYSYKRQQR